jgi:hypothetical protein
MSKEFVKNPKDAIKMVETKYLLYIHIINESDYKNDDLMSHKERK